MNLRKASVMGLMLLGTLSLQAQVGRTFVLKNSAVIATYHPSYANTCVQTVPWND